MSQESKIPFLRNFNPGMNLMTVFSLVFLGVIVGDLVFWMLAKAFWGVNTFSENNVLSNELTPSTFAYIQTNYIVHAICVFLTPATVFRRLMEFPQQDYFLIRRAVTLRTAGIILLVFLACFPAANFLVYFNQQLDFSFLSPEIGQQIKAMENSNDEFKIQLLGQPGYSSLFINLATTAVLAAIGEELLFRSIFQRLFIKLFRNVHVAVIVGAALFSFVHFSYYGFIPRFFMGMALGYIYLATANIWYCIFFHFLNNALGVTMGWLMGRGYNVSFFDSFGGGTDTKWIGFGLLVIVVACLILMINKLINKELVHEIKEY